MSFQQRYILFTHRLGYVCLYTQIRILFYCFMRFQEILMEKHSKWPIAICNHLYEFCVFWMRMLHNGIHIVVANPFWQQTSVVAEK